MLTIQRISELLDYNKDTGIFVWKIRTSNCIQIGDIAGGLNVDGYLRIKIDGKKYFAHRLAWACVYGSWPVNDIDHIDGIRNNNRISNLRDVTRSVNLQNQHRANYDNKTGLLGVSAHRKGFKAKIQIDGKEHCLGTYSTPEKAHEIYLEEKRKIHSGCTI